MNSDEIEIGLNGRKRISNRAQDSLGFTLECGIHPFME